mmetsp:Transcript_5951/g.10352  ORF Transcript_5951/g.10352 Transcript_5951/m.10352 type:complete len:232 (+) Transcript_5951:1278-1973(+)
MDPAELPMLPGMAVLPRRGGNKPHSGSATPPGRRGAMSPERSSICLCWLAGSVGNADAMVLLIMPSSASAWARTSSSFLAVNTSRRGTQLLFLRSSTSLITKRMRADTFLKSEPIFSRDLSTSSSFFFVSGRSLLVSRMPAVVIISHAASMLCSGGTRPLNDNRSSMHVVMIQSLTMSCLYNSEIRRTFPNVRFFTARSACSRSLRSVHLLAASRAASVPSNSSWHVFSRI